jgi:glycopeptide antibiotics resistance protein
LEHAVSLGLTASVAVAVLATLAPFRLRLPAAWCVDTALRTSDVLLNVALLAPLGFALGMRMRTRGRGASVTEALAVGAGLSMTLELAQLLVPGRCSSPIDLVANALGCGLGALLHAQVAAVAERALLAFLRSTPNALAVLVLAAALARLALPSLDARLMHATFRWTLGPASLAYGPQSIVIGLIASLGLSAWLAFTLRMRARSVAAATACALSIASAIEVCRGYSVHHEASLLTLALAALCALVSAHVAGRIAAAARPPVAAGTSRSVETRVWV